MLLNQKLMQMTIIKIILFKIKPKFLAKYFELEYSKILIFLILASLICLLMLTIAYFLSLTTVKDSEKLSEYECGFEPFDNATRHPFDVHFYIVGILFLIFDVEIAVLFP
jgi:NADH-quinone oxidoreductase subunit A